MHKDTNCSALMNFFGQVFAIKTVLNIFLLWSSIALNGGVVVDISSNCSIAHINSGVPFQLEHSETKYLTFPHNNLALQSSRNKIV